MPSQYISIDKVKYERDLVEAADKASKPIGMNTALQLWCSALDGNKITEIEDKTLKRIADGKHGAVTPDAKAWILNKTARWAAREALVKKKPEGKATGNKTLKDHGSIRVDAALLQHADDCNEGGQTISFDDAQDLIDNAMDGKGITKVEQTTLEHIIKHYRIEERAKALLSNAVSALLDMNKYAHMLTGDEAPVPAGPVGPVAPSPDGDLAVAIIGYSMIAKPAVDAAVPKIVLDGKLEELFKQCSIDGDGKISKIELIKACRGDPHLAGYFALTHSIRTEDGRDQMEKIFQAIGKDDSKTITKEELIKFFAGKAVASPAEEPEAKHPRVGGTGYTGGAGTEVKPPESYLPTSADPSSYKVSGGTGYTGGAGTEVKLPESYQPASADPSSYQVSGGDGYKGGAGTEVKPPESYQPASADPSSYQVSGGTGYPGGAGTEVKPPESYQPATADPSSYQVSAGTGYKGGAGMEVKDPASYQVAGAAATEAQAGGYAAPPTAAYTAAPYQA